MGGPKTEYEWDAYIKFHGPTFFHCWWLATYDPARGPARKRVPPKKKHKKRGVNNGTTH